MDAGQSISVSMKDYTETTCRNYATTLGKSLSRVFTVNKGTKAYTITRTA